jgi:DNA-binding transcriptional regulator YiaG
LSRWCTLVVMVQQAVTSREELLASIRARRTLPLPAERRRIREAAGVSLRQLGSALGASPMAVFRWEQGAQPRDPQQAREYASLLDELRNIAA